MNMRDNITWRKSSYSNASGGHCVEIAETPSTVLVRDTQNRELGHVQVSAQAWAAFLRSVKADFL